MSDTVPSPEWLEAANRLATVARQLVAIVHETNNLLQVISGNAEMLEMSGELSERAIKRTETIAAHAQRASVLLTDILRFSRDQAGDAARLDMSAVVREAIGFRRYPATKARIDVELSAPVQEWATANRRRTLQILLNLLMNAEQALAGREDGRIAVTVGRVGDRVVVTIADNGAGDSDLAPRAALPGVPAGVPPQLGIGLRVAEWLAEEQGGRLTMERPATGGTKVTLEVVAAEDGEIADR